MPLTDIPYDRAVIPLANPADQTVSICDDRKTAQHWAFWRGTWAHNDRAIFALRVSRTVGP